MRNFILWIVISWSSAGVVFASGQLEDFRELDIVPHIKTLFLELISDPLGQSLGAETWKNRYMRVFANAWKDLQTGYGDRAKREQIDKAVALILSHYVMNGPPGLTDNFFENPDHVKTIGDFWQAMIPAKGKVNSINLLSNAAGALPWIDMIDMKPAVFLNKYGPPAIVRGIEVMLLWVHLSANYPEEIVAAANHDVVKVNLASLTDLASTYFGVKMSESVTKNDDSNVSKVVSLPDVRTCPIVGAIVNENIRKK